MSDQWQSISDSWEDKSSEVPLDMPNRSDISIGGPGGQLAAVGGKRSIFVMDLDNLWQSPVALAFPGNWCVYDMGIW